MTSTEAMTVDILPLWQRMLITLLSMLVASFLAGWIWKSSLGFDMPSYMAGIVGGLTAVPVWELVKRLRPA